MHHRIKGDILATDWYFSAKIPQCAEERTSNKPRNPHPKPFIFAKATAAQTCNFVFSNFRGKMNVTCWFPCQMISLFTSTSEFRFAVYCKVWLECPLPALTRARILFVKLNIVLLIGSCGNWSHITSKTCFNWPKFSNFEWKGLEAFQHSYPDVIIKTVKVWRSCWSLIFVK
jgi:hypothetical protein